MDAVLFSHMPVMPDEIMEGLNINPCGVYVDGTVGGGGHAERIAERLTLGRLVGIDRDATAVEAAEERLRVYASRCTLIRGNFNQLRPLVSALGIAAVDGVLLDLGVSSHQLDTPERGFSYRFDAPLDMRMDCRDTLTGLTVVNEYTEQQLTKIIFTYGEERYAKQIARHIVRARQIAPIETTGALACIIENAIPYKNRQIGGHPAKRTFQAIRIEVNGELHQLEESLRDITRFLKPGGRFCVITFHSLEDRIVKHCFRSLANPCLCPRELPVCVCGKKPLVRPITRKPMVPSEAECQANHRAHSAKLRIIERTDVYEEVP